MNSENEPRVPAGQPGGGQWTASADVEIKRAEDMAAAGSQGRHFTTPGLSDGRTTQRSEHDYSVSGQTAAGSHLKEQWFRHANAAERLPAGSPEKADANRAADKIADSYERIMGKPL